MSDESETGDDRAPLFDRDYSEEFPVTLEWGEWTRLFNVYRKGMGAKEDDWPEEELERDRELRDKLSREINEAKPGNGMGDWPETMKEAYDATVEKMIHDELTE